MERQEFIDNLAKCVQKYAPQFNVKVCSPIIAQGMLESSCGTSPKGLKNNFFGLKYREGRLNCYNGTFIDVSKEQNPDGTYRDIIDEWYTFENMDKGVLGYFQFTNIINYASCKNITDPEQYLKNLKAAGYASSNDYVKNLMEVIRDNGLTKYDTAENKKMKYKVAIDAGHGSNTAGKRTPDGFREHWINVACASYCEQALKRSGISVLRVAWDDNNAKDDEDVALSVRQKLIKTNKCDLSVSFHANAAGSGGWSEASGVETLISNKSPADSKNLANIIQGYLVKGTPQKNRGVKTQSLAMCNCSALNVKAAVLVEIGFMTNKAEADLMKTDKFCREQAEEIAHGVCDYLGVPFVGVGSVIGDVAEQVKNTPTGYLVKINTDELNVRAYAGPSYPVVTKVKRGQIYTIVDEMNGWGKLKSGVGWLKLSYTVKM